MIIDDLKTIIRQNRSIKNREYLRNLLKEALQLYVLNFIYTSSYNRRFQASPEAYKSLIFTGGTCLRRFYNLPRLSEDLDFDIEAKTFPFEKFAADLENYFTKDLQYKNLRIKFRQKNKTFFLRFPVLKEIGFSSEPETDILFVRLDLAFNQSQNFQTERQFLSTPSFSFLVKTYDFPTLFANKICAFLTREFKKRKEQKEPFKGRDVFDLVWMLQRAKELSLKPNFARITDLTGVKREEVGELIKKKAQKVDPKALNEDLRGFFPDLNFVGDFCQNFKILLLSNLYILF